MMDNTAGKDVIVPSGEWGTVNETRFDAPDGVVAVRLWGVLDSQAPPTIRYYHTDDLKFVNSDAGIVALNPLREELAEARAYKKAYEENQYVSMAILTAACAAELRKMGMEDDDKFFHRVVDAISASIKEQAKEPKK